VTLKAEKPKAAKYPKTLETLGDHVRKKRLDLGLIQRNVADQIGVSESTIYNWERNSNSPQVHQIPAVIRFLGYNPFPSEVSFADTLMVARRMLGLSQKAMAERLGIDPGTLKNWENGKRPSMKLKRQIGDFIGFCETALE
jgi:DNA-binding XRE family transcriptional regulator